MLTLNKIAEKELLREKVLIEAASREGGLSLKDARRLTQIKGELAKLKRTEANPVAKV